jgi:hypothetical protein
MLKPALSKLAADIRLILSQATSAGQVYTYRLPARALTDAAAGIIARHDLPVEVVRPEEVELSNEQVVLLKTLHAGQSPEAQTAFRNLVFSQISGANVVVAVAALLETGHFASLLKMMAAETPDDRVSSRLSLWKGMRVVLSRQSHRFTGLDLTNLAKLRMKDAQWFAKRANQTMEGVRFRPASPFVPFLSAEERQLGRELELVQQTFDRVLYLRLQAELMEGANPEINTDQQVLVSRMEELGFRRDIVGSLQDLDRKIHEAGKPVDFKGCMDLARTIFEEIAEDSGRKAATLVGYTLTPKDVKSNFGPWKEVLVKTGAITGGEGVLLQTLYDYVSTAGTHRLGSKPEQVRVTRNMIIELGLLVVGRVQALGIGAPQ